MVISTVAFTILLFIYKSENNRLFILFTFTHAQFSSVQFNFM